MKIILNDGTEIELYDFNESSLTVVDTLENIVSNVYNKINDDNLKSFTISDALDVNYEYFKSSNVMTVTPASDNEVYARFDIQKLSDVDIEIIKLRQAVAANGTLTIIFANVSSLPKTIYDTAITSNMVVTGKEFSNDDAIITDFSVTIADGSVTISGNIIGTTNITLYLTTTH